LSRSVFGETLQPLPSSCLNQASTCPSSLQSGPPPPLPFPSSLFAFFLRKSLIRESVTAVFRFHLRHYSPAALASLLIALHTRRFLPFCAFQKTPLSANYPDPTQTHLTSTRTVHLILQPTYYCAESPIHASQLTTSPNHSSLSIICCLPDTVILHFVFHPRCHFSELPVHCQARMSTQPLYSHSCLIPSTLKSVRNNLLIH
jgi:hypothetical protein